MATILKTPTGARRYSSYYLAVTEKNRLRKQGIEAELVEAKDYNSNYTGGYEEEQRQLREIRLKYEPIMTHRKKTDGADN